MLLRVAKPCPQPGNVHRMLLGGGGAGSDGRGGWAQAREEGGKAAEEEAAGAANASAGVCVVFAFAGMSAVDTSEDDDALSMSGEDAGDTSCVVTALVLEESKAGALAFVGMGTGMDMGAMEALRVGTMEAVGSVGGGSARVSKARTRIITENNSKRNQYT